MKDKMKDDTTYLTKKIRRASIAGSFQVAFRHSIVIVTRVVHDGIRIGQSPERIAERKRKKQKNELVIYFWNSSGRLGAMPPAT